jgi:hypothetical protein
MGARSTCEDVRQCLKLCRAVWSLGAMQTRPNPPDEITPAPEPFRAALAELVQFGMNVARLVSHAADAEMALAEAAATVASGVSPVANSLAEAIEADRAAAAAGEARRDVVERTAIIAAAFNRVARAVRLTVLLAERLDRGWARPGRADDRQAMARRQIDRAVHDAISSDADVADVERLNGELRERLDSMDTLDEIGNRPVADVIREICRDLGVDPARLLSGAAVQAAAPVFEPPVLSLRARRRARREPAREHPS